MTFKGVKMSCFLALLVGFLISTSESRTLDNVNTSHAVASSDTSGFDDSSLKKKEEANTGDVSIQGQPTTGGEGDTKTFGLISHLLGKLPFWPKQKETTTTITTSNSVPSIPASSVTGK